MWHLKSRKGEKSSFQMAVLVFAISLLASMGVVQYSTARTYEMAREHAAHMASGKAARLQNVIESLLFTVRTTEVLLEEYKGVILDFDHIMESIVGEYPIKSMAIAPDGVITQVYPYAGNEEAVGHDLFTDENRVTELELAKDTEKFTLSGHLS